MYQFEKREVFGNFGERNALGRKEETIREFCGNFGNQKEKKIFSKKIFLVFSIAISKLFSRSGNSALFKRVVIYKLNF